MNLKLYIFLFTVNFVSSFKHYTIHKNKLMKPIHVCKPLILNKNEITCINYQDYMKDKYIFIIDMDKTVCHTKCGNYIHSIPDHRVIHKLNKFYENGHELHYWNERGNSWNDMTQRQLKIWNVKYNSLNIGEPKYNDKSKNKQIVYVKNIKNEDDIFFNKYIHII